MANWSMYSPSTRRRFAADFGDRAETGGLYVQDGLAGGGEGLVEEGVAIAAGPAVVAGVAELDREDGLHRRGIEEQEVDVLAADLALVSSANES